MHAATRLAPMQDDPFDSTLAERETLRSSRELAHDLSHALTAVSGGLEALERTLARMAFVDSSAHRALSLARSALHGAELATWLAHELGGDARRAPEILSLEPLIEAAIAIAESGAGRHGTIVSLARPRVHALVRAVRSDLLSVLVNLLSNALEATDPARRNHVVIRTRTRPKEVELIVRDTGSGMTPEDCARVLAGAAASPHGVGLRIVTRLVEHAGGTFALESELGVGTMARVTLPLAELDEDLW
jgi:signal transduction histidine kinase